jgi:uridine kinase
MVKGPFELRSSLDRRPPRNGRFHTIAIDGRGGSGKTHLADYVARLLRRFVVVNGDDYFEPLDEQLSWGDFNETRFTTDVVLPLQHGAATLTYQPYDFEHRVLQQPQQLRLDHGLVVERCFTIGMPIHWDLKIWVETPREACLQRGLARELMPPERVAAVWQQLWQPREDQYIDEVGPQTVADLVIDGTRPFGDQLR